MHDRNDQQVIFLQHVEHSVGETASLPEPGSLALLALGGVGLLEWRQRRAARA